MANTIILETRRSKGVYKADLTNFSKEEIKNVLEFYDCSSYVAVKNYRSKTESKEPAVEIKFHRQSAKGLVKYSLKTSLSKEDLNSIGFKETPNKNMHLTEAGCTIDNLFDIEVKEPVKKISSKKSKNEKVNEKKESNPSNKTPLVHPETIKEEKVVAIKTPLPTK